jgi:hypoxanthine phosphoribosyltransferase
MIKIDNKIHLYWNDVEGLVDILCEKIETYLEKDIKIDGIYGLSRGGLIPAVMISHKLDIPWVVPLFNKAKSKNTLIIDDICDSGNTLQNWINNGFKTATLHFKPHTSCCMPALWSNTHEGDEWIIYPWEESNSAPIQDYLSKFGDSN